MSVDRDPKSESSDDCDNSEEDKVIDVICDDIILEDEPAYTDCSAVEEISFGGYIACDSVSDNDDGQGGDDVHDSDMSDTVDSNVILISDTDEQAVAIPDEKVLVQTYVITVRKRTRYINGGVIDTKVQIERDYYQHNE